MLAPPLLITTPALPIWPASHRSLTPPPGLPACAAGAGPWHSSQVTAVWGVQALVVTGDHED